jgi:enoyl-CoA hydratase/carnithine racemase
LLLTGQRIHAPELYRLGVLEACVPGDQLLATATAIAREIASKSPLAIRMLKQSLNTVENLTLRDGIAWNRTWPSSSVKASMPRKPSGHSSKNANRFSQDADAGPYRT